MQMKGRQNGARESIWPYSRVILELVDNWCCKGTKLSGQMLVQEALSAGYSFRFQVVGESLESLEVVLGKMEWDSELKRSLDCSFRVAERRRHLYTTGEVVWSCGSSFLCSLSSLK
jgi:hypothetical protein